MSSKTLPLAVVEEAGVKFETGVPVEFEYLRNTEPSPKQRGNTQFQQQIEPAGRYMLLRDSHGALAPGWQSGTIQFDRPLVLHFNTGDEGGYDEHSWKAHLSRAYRGKKGRSLSRAILADGYDGIVTVGNLRKDMFTKEIVDLTVIRDQEVARRLANP